MGLTSNQRTSRSSSSKEDLPVSSSSSPNSTPTNNKKWSNLMPICIALVVIAEIAFLARLDMSKNAMIVNSWIDSSFSSLSLGNQVIDDGIETCENWLEREDSVEYVRDFGKDPVWISGPEEELKICAVGCKFGFNSDKKPDGVFNSAALDGPLSIHRSMESSAYYSENSIDHARRWSGDFSQHEGRSRGYTIVLSYPVTQKSKRTLEIRSLMKGLCYNVPVGYFSWAEYDIMAPVQPKTESALAAAFISNCAARNFRLQALEALEKANIKIDSYGACHRNHDGHVDKLETLKRYKFSLAFENSNEEDYVTEKYFQSLVAGSIPVVVGAPNIEEFAPSPGSILHIKELKDADSIARTMKSLANNSDAYNKFLRWKYEGPSDSFKALVDMAAVHSSCRLCIHLATLMREKEEKKLEVQKRPCKCTRSGETVYHIYVRERGRFQMESIFLRYLFVPKFFSKSWHRYISRRLDEFVMVMVQVTYCYKHNSRILIWMDLCRSGNLTLKALETAVMIKFRTLNHVPIWRKERPESIRGDGLKIYRIYPASMTQRQALYTFRFDEDNELQTHIEQNPCPKFEVIFV